MKCGQSFAPSLFAGAHQANHSRFICNKQHSRPYIACHSCICGGGGPHRVSSVTDGNSLMPDFDVKMITPQSNFCVESRRYCPRNTTCSSLVLRFPRNPFYLSWRVFTIVTQRIKYTCRHQRRSLDLEKSEGRYFSTRRAI